MKQMDLITAEELSEQLRIPKNTVYHLAKIRKIPSAFKVGKHWRFRQDMILEWLDKETRDTSASGASTRVSPPKNVA